MDPSNVYPYIYTNEDVPIGEHNVHTWMQEHVKWKEL